jgi:hypothetical protein
VTHEADDDAVLFSFSDRPVQQKLDLFREDRGNAEVGECSCPSLRVGTGGEDADPPWMKVGQSICSN